MCACAAECKVSGWCLRVVLSLWLGLELGWSWGWGRGCAPLPEHLALSPQLQQHVAPSPQFKAPPLPLGQLGRGKVGIIKGDD